MPTPPPRLRFKDLALNQEFEFDHSDPQFGSCRDITHGPWVKVGPRRFRRVGVGSTRPQRIGSSQAPVRLDSTCGGADAPPSVAHADPRV